MVLTLTQEITTTIHRCSGLFRYENITKIPIERGAEVNAINGTTYGSGQSPLMWSAQEGNMELMVLLENGADVNAKDKFGFTALHAAALKGYVKIA